MLIDRPTQHASGISGLCYEPLGIATVSGTTENMTLPGVLAVDLQHRAGVAPVDAGRRPGPASLGVGIDSKVTSRKIDLTLPNKVVNVQING